MAKSVWLRCRIGKGMFSSEAVVVISMADGNEMAFFVPIGAVRPAPEAAKELEGRVQVHVQRLSNVIWATIPAPQPATVPVREGDLVTAA